MVENLTNRFWKFIKRPEGNAYDEAFTLEETTLVAPVDGQVIVKISFSRRRNACGLPGVKTATSRRLI